MKTATFPSLRVDPALRQAAEDVLDPLAAVVDGVFQELPFEFAMEASQLLKLSLEGAIG